MLTLKELDYVTAQRTPYPGDLWSKLTLMTLKDALELYKKDYSGKQYEITFSDGGNIDFEIASQNISHMLGLVIPPLKALPEFKGEKNNSYGSYRILETIVDNIDDMLELNAKEKYNLFNFYRIYVRSMVFLKFSNFRDFNFSCINYKLPEAGPITTNMKSDKFLFTQSGEPNAPYFMMGLAKNDSDQIYVETLFADKYPEKMFTNQRITIPTLVAVSSPSNYFHDDAPPIKKLEMIRFLKQNLSQYNCNFDVLSDYMSELSLTANKTI